MFAKPLERLVMSNLLFSILSDIKTKAEQLVRDESQHEEKIEEDDDVFEARVSARYRELRTDFLITLNRWFRDLLVLRAGGDEALLYHKGKADVLRDRSARLTLAQAVYNLEAVEELSRQMEKSLSEETLLAYALDRMNHGVA
jgi:hypothetical protein